MTTATGTFATNIFADDLQEPMSFEAYYELSQSLFAQGRTTSESENYNTAEILDYAKVNLARMKRLLKTVKVTEEVTAALAEMPAPQRWFVLTESWCGDAAQVTPIINQIASESAQVDLVMVLRDKNLDLMDAFLTNGGRSIPKLIATDALTGRVLGSWGPRPAAAQSLVMELKAENTPFPELAEKLHGWYAQNASMDTQAELADAIRQWSKTQ